LRASFYWVLIDFFGNVPIVDRFDVPEGFLPEQSARKEVYDFIISEILENISLVSSENKGKAYGKFNQLADSPNGDHRVLFPIPGQNLTKIRIGTEFGIFVSTTL